MSNNQKDLALTILYFSLSTIATALFMYEKFSLYDNYYQLLLSGAIAGTKWGIQLLAAFLFLGRKRFEFMRRIGLVCFIGSLLLLSTYALAYFHSSNTQQFICALFLSIITMISLYYRAIMQTGISLRWFFGWIVCLAIAITLQLTVVFHII
jgi:hypothetical protein